MSAAIPPVFQSQRTATAARLRLALAISVSALIHSWLVAGIAVEAPGNTAVRPLTVITARLEITAPATRTAPSSESTAADAAVMPVVKDAAERAPRLPRLPARAPSVYPSPAPEIAATSFPGPALPSIPDPVYYPARQLDVYPALLQPLSLAYPERAAREGVSGKVIVMLLIDENGMVNGLSMVEAEPAGYFEETVRAVFSETRFAPARKNGRVVKSRVLISVNYSPAPVEGALR